MRIDVMREHLERVFRYKPFARAAVFASISTSQASLDSWSATRRGCVGFRIADDRDQDRFLLLDRRRHNTGLGTAI
jgi:hypothetical protein